MAKQPAYKNVGFAQVLDLSDLVGAEVQKKRLRDEQVKKTITDVASIDLSGVREASIEGVTAMHQDLFRYVADNAKELNDPMANPNAWKDFMSKKHQLLQAVTLDKQLGAAANDNVKLFAEEEEYGMRANTNRAIISAQVNTSAVSKDENGNWIMNPDASESLTRTLMRGQDLTSYTIDNFALEERELGTTYKDQNVQGKLYRERQTRFGASEEEARNEALRLMSAPAGAVGVATYIESTYPDAFAKLGNPESISIQQLIGSEDEEIRQVGEALVQQQTQIGMSTVPESMKTAMMSGPTEDGGGGASTGARIIDFDNLLQGVGTRITDPQGGDLATENISVDLGDGREVVLMRAQRLDGDSKGSYATYPLFISNVEEVNGQKVRTREVISADEFESIRAELNRELPDLTVEIGNNTSEKALEMYYFNQIAGTTGGKLTKDEYLNEMGVSSFTELAQKQVDQHISQGNRWKSEGMVTTTDRQINVRFGNQGETEAIAFNPFKRSESENAFVSKINTTINEFVNQSDATKYTLPVEVDVQGKKVSLNVMYRKGDGGELVVNAPGADDANRQMAFEQTFQPDADGNYNMSEVSNQLSNFLMNQAGRFAQGAGRKDWNKMPEDEEDGSTGAEGDGIFG
jgi:hypothetical protein